MDVLSYLTPLGSLTNLTELRIGNENYRFIEDLADLDFSLLSNLSKLYVLELPPARVSDIGFLRDMTNLTSLSLYGNEVSDFSPLSNLTRLRFLVLTAGDSDGKSTRISDIGFLSRLTNLTLLDLDYNSVSDISVLSGLRELTTLSLIGNKITNTNPLVTNTGLGNGDDQIDLRGNCFDATTGSEALQNIKTIEDRNPDAKNVYFDSRADARCNL